MKPKRGTGSIYKRGNIWWIKYYQGGDPIRESSESEKESDAWKLLRRRQADITIGRFTGPDADKVTIKELSEDLKNHYTADGNKKSLEALGWRLKHLLPFFGHLKAHGLRAEQVNKYIVMRQEGDAANATIDRELAALKRMYSLGIQTEKIFRKPYIRMLRENNVRKGFYEHGEFIALRRALPDYLRPVVTFAYYTGWRREEILSLQWKQVDLANKSVRLDPGTTKNGDGRIIFLEGEPLEALIGQSEKRKHVHLPNEGSPVLLCPYVFHRNGKPIRDFRDAWAKACEATGLTGRLFHDFRRTAVKNMVDAGVPERVAMAISGHKTRSMFDRYHIVPPADLQTAASRIWAHAESKAERLTVVPLVSVGSSV
jgi:integrase